MFSCSLVSLTKLVSCDFKRLVFVAKIACFLPSDHSSAVTTVGYKRLLTALKGAEYQQVTEGTKVQF